MQVKFCISFNTALTVAPSLLIYTTIEARQSRDILTDNYICITCTESIGKYLCEVIRSSTPTTYSIFMTYIMIILRIYSQHNFQFPQRFTGSLEQNTVQPWPPEQLSCSQDQTCTLLPPPACLVPLHVPCIQPENGHFMLIVPSVSLLSKPLLADGFLGPQAPAVPLRARCTQTVCPAGLLLLQAMMCLRGAKLMKECLNAKDHSTKHLYLPLC